MEINIGEYVRTSIAPEILKIIEVRKDNRCITDKYSNLILQLNRDFTKHSKNIIDLIEAGDYVNGYKVVKDNLESAEYGKYVDVYCPSKNLELNFLEHVFPEHIKTILTHEQYEENSYEVVE